MNRASLGLSQPTVQRQTGRRRDLRSRFNFSFLHQSLLWLVLFLTVEVNYITFPFQILPKSLCFGIFIVILSCHTACFACRLFIVFVVSFFRVFFLLNLFKSYSSWLDDCCREMSPRLTLSFFLLRICT